MINETQKTNKQQKKFELKDEEGNTLTLSGHHWDVKSIEISPVCITVDVKHKSRGSTTDSHWHEAQNELFEFLKGISNIAADRNIMHPMIGFVTTGTEKDETKKEELQSKVLSWSADQDWHQGNFILYVTADSSDTVPKKDELLSENPDVLGSDRYQRPEAKKLIDDIISEKSDMKEKEKKIFDLIRRTLHRKNFSDKLDLLKEDLMKSIAT